jgi:hypothetical protein
MSQNILVLIRQDIKELDDKVGAIQTAVDDIKANLPDVSAISDKLDAHASQLDSISTTVNNINDALNVNPITSQTTTTKSKIWPPKK